MLPASGDAYLVPSFEATLSHEISSDFIITRFEVLLLCMYLPSQSRNRRVKGRSWWCGDES